MKDKATMTIKFRISPSEYRILRSRADRYYGGNISECIREAIKRNKIKGPTEVDPKKQRLKKD